MKVTGSIAQSTLCSAAHRRSYLSDVLSPPRASARLPVSTPKASTMIKRILPLVTLAALLISGCEKTPSDTAADVAGARKNAIENVGEARLDANGKVTEARNQVSEAQDNYAESDKNAAKALSEAESKAMIKTAKAQYEVAKVEAEGRYDIEKEKCTGLKGVTEDACLSSAAAVRAEALAKATEARDQVLLSAEYHH